MKIAFVRHGETTLNEQGRMTGRMDVNLNEKGLRQAEETRSSLQSLYDVLYSSSLKRSVQTATAINENLRIPLLIDDSILERDFGSLTGKTWNEINEELCFDARSADREQRYDYRLFGGESAQQVRERLVAFIERVKTGAYKRPLVVCHGGIIRMLHHAHEREFGHIENASVHEFDL
ncbi:MAG TPA: histidine phosphatase family protein [Candidatus Paceibacterota bacterium]